MIELSGTITPDASLTGSVSLSDSYAVVDNEMNPDSTNPVSNSAVCAALVEKLDKSESLSAEEIKELFHD